MSLSENLSKLAKLITATATGLQVATPNQNDNSAHIANTEYVDRVSMSPLFDVSAAVVFNQYSIILQQCSLDFRSASLGDGLSYTSVLDSALSVLILEGATLGTEDGVPAKLTVLAIKDISGTIELAVVNNKGGLSLNEQETISTIAMSATADSANVVYSLTARSNVPYRVVGTIDTLQAVAGTWASLPSRAQGAGGFAVPPPFRGCLASKTVSQSIPNTTFTHLLFDGEVYDTDNIHSIVTATDSFVVPAGVTKIKMHLYITWSYNATGVRQIHLQKNGNGFFPGACKDYVNGVDMSVGASREIISPTLLVAAGDTFKFQAYQSSGAALNATGDVNGVNTWASMEIKG